MRAWSTSDITFEIDEGSEFRVAVIVITTPAGTIDVMAEIDEIGEHIAANPDRTSKVRSAPMP